MAIPLNIHLPTDKELTVPEINLSGPALLAGAHHLGNRCEFVNNEFMLCKQELKDPRKCINEGKAVTACAMKFFQDVKRVCAGEFTQYVNCLDKSSCDQNLKVCRKTQSCFDKCMKDNLGVERPHYGKFSEVQIHHTKRPRPPKEEPQVFCDTPDSLPKDAEKPPAKYGSRYMLFW